MKTTISQIDLLIVEQIALNLNSKWTGDYSNNKFTEPELNLIV